MTIRILVIDDELGRLAYKREEFLGRWSWKSQGSFDNDIEFAFITSQRVEDDRLVNDAAVSVEYVAQNPEAWALVLLDMQFDHGPMINGEPVEADRQFGLQIQAALSREFPQLPVVQFTAQSQKDLARHDGIYLSKIDGTQDDLRLMLVQIGRLSIQDKARLLQIPEDTVVASEATIALYADVFRRGRAHTPLLIRGETGTGKEHLARYVHLVSRPEGAPWVALQVSAIPSTLYESALFGHEKGAFTGAEAQRSGAFTQAGQGTLFLDEIGSLPPDLQAKLLRALGERKFRRVGGSEEFQIRCGLVAATQDDLESNGFRTDLLARFSEVTIPPLRLRPGELLPMAEHFLNAVQAAYGKRGMVLSTSARHGLERATFLDNSRGLRRAIEHAVLSLSSGSVIGAAHLPLPLNEKGAARTASDSRHLRVTDVPPICVPTLGRVVEDLAKLDVPTQPEQLHGVLSRLEVASDRLKRELAISALRGCRHPITHRPKVLPAMQLLTGNEQMTPTQAKRMLNELLGRPQNAPQGEAWLRELCEGASTST